MSRRGVALVASLSALAAVGAMAAEPAPLAARAFTIQADAFPVEPAPGTNDTSIGVRPAGTRISVSNAPAAAYGRAAATDAGTIELYTGPPPPSTVAECDATAPNIPRRATATPMGMQLAATCDTRPSARAVAIGGGTGASRSEVTGDGGGDALVADARAVVDDTVVGAIRLGSVEYHASARTTGRPGGASAVGNVEVSDATVAGVPVTIGADGIAVDESKVPLDLVPTASEAVRTALSQGDYSDVRVVQPRTAVAPDGSRAEVSGGGVSFFGQNPDPANNYFLRITLVGGSVLVALGGDSGSPAMVPVPAGRELDDDIARPGPIRPASPPAIAASPSPTTAPAPAPPVELVARRDTATLPRPWSGWVWVVGAAVALAGAAATQRRRVVRWWDTTADRYVRG